MCRRHVNTGIDKATALPVQAAPGLAACCEVGTGRPEHVREAGPASRGVVWQRQRNSPEMRLTEPATMTTPNT